MKKAIVILLTAFLAFSLAVTATASDNALRLYDGSDLLSDAEEAAILSKLDSVSNSYKADIVIVTVDSIGELTATEYADLYFEAFDFGYGNDGILLLISMEYRDYHISTSGKCISIFSDSVLDEMCDSIEGYLSNGNWYGAFDAYISDCEHYINVEINGSPFNYTKGIIISAVIGLVIAFIVGGSLKGQLKTVRAQVTASNYVTDGSLNITNSNDFFLYRNVVRRAKPQNNSNGSSTHRSPSGHTHGGRGGKF